MSVVEFGPAQLETPRRLRDGTIVLPVGNKKTQMREPSLVETFDPSEWSRRDSFLFSKKHEHEPPFVMRTGGSLGIRSIWGGVFQIVDPPHKKIFTYVYPPKSTTFQYIAEKYVSERSMRRGSLSVQYDMNKVPANVRDLVRENMAVFEDKQNTPALKGPSPVPRRSDGTIVFPLRNAKNLDLAHAVISPKSTRPAKDAQSTDGPFVLGIDGIGLRNMCGGELDILDPVKGTISRYSMSSENVVFSVAKKYFGVTLVSCFKTASASNKEEYIPAHVEDEDLLVSRSSALPDIEDEAILPELERLRL